MLTVIGAFDDRTHAQAAVEKLVQYGFSRDELHIEQGETAVETDESRGDSGGGGFFASLFGIGDSHEVHRNNYHEAVRRGTSVVVVDVGDDAQAEKAVTCLHELGAIDVDERAEQWRSTGWSPQQAAPRQDLQGVRDTMSDSAPPQGQEGVLDVVQEELQIGKRSLDKGGVRVVQRVTETPVREVVRLREERAVVNRQPVDRPATVGDLNTFKEGTLEVREMAEVPVVAKTARVVEEVRVGKEVTEREETVEDTVRRKDVEVQRVEGNARGTAERERAVASDRSHEDAVTNRDPDARTPLRKNDGST